MNSEHGIKTTYMDRSADPGKDFFRYANGQWLDTTDIPDEYPRWGSFLILRDNNLAQLHALLQDAAASDAPAGSVERKVGDFFSAGMNEAKIEREGIKPLAAELARIDRVRTASDIADIVARLHLYGAGVIFGFGSGQDYADSTQVIAHAGQSGLGLPDRDYYTKTDDESVELRRKYVAHVSRMLQLSGYTKRRSNSAAKAILAIETALAEASFTRSERRDPHKNYNKMPLGEFEAMVPNFPVRRYLKTLGAPSIEELNVAQPQFFKAVNDLLGTTKVSAWKHYFRWNLVRLTASCLSSAFGDEKFDFYGRTLTGQKAQTSRWKRIVSATSADLGDAVGELYVARHYPPQAKARMDEMVNNLRAALRDSINSLDWMSEATRTAALAKLDSFVAKIGYPDRWTDYSTVRIGRSSYVWNMLRCNQFAVQQDNAKIGKQVDRSEWLMSPQTVNAYYMPPMNEIVFPAAILQPPFFDMEADDAYNYGGIGVVIGHEMTHGFDDKGSKFDAQGNLKMWWTAEDRAEFERRIALIKEQYGQFEVAGGKRLIPDLISGEAAADLGGAKLAYMALQKALANKGRSTDENGFTDEQRFFLAFGQIWASKATPEYEQMSVSTDPHPPGKYRVLGTLAHLDEFPQAFGLPDDCDMMLPPEKRCRLW